MHEHEDWIFRPVLRGLIRYESLFDSSLDLAAIALINEALDVEAENVSRAREHEAKHRGK